MTYKQIFEESISSLRRELQEKKAELRAFEWLVTTGDLREEGAYKLIRWRWWYRVLESSEYTESEKNEFRKIIKPLQNDENPKP